MITVMIVDDEELIRVSLRYAIGCVLDDVHIVAEASNGREALELAQRLLPDIVITDVKMPLMDGLELIRSLREQGPQCQIIVLSGYAEFEFAQQAIRYQVSEYLLKPISQDKLKEALDRCIALCDTAEPMAGDESIAGKIVSEIKARFAEELSLDMLAREFNFNSKYISTLIKNETGEGFSSYVTSLRLHRAIELLTHTNMDIKEIACQVGYPDQHYFSRLIRKQTGMMPSDFRKKKRSKA